MSTNTDAGYCRASAVDLTEPEIIHSCPIQSLYHNAPSIFPVGNTIITWTITDVSGMSATCQQTITVKKIADENLLYSYVILSNDEIKMKENMVESGGIGVMSSKKISLEQNTKIVGIHTFVKSQNIDIKSGSMATNQIKAKVPVSMMPPFAENNSPGNNDIKISDNKPPVSLKSGSYGKVEIGKNVIVTFSGQSKVFIKELKLEDGSQLKFDQSTQLMIDKKLDIENFVNINQQEMTGIQFYVEEAVKIGKSCNVRANIFTKKEIKISKATANKRTYMTGIFVADKVDAEDYVTWNWDPSYCPQEPDLELNSKTNGEIPFVNYFEKFPYTDKTQILIHPNPANQMIQVKINEKSESNYLLRILNSMGKEVYQQYHPSNIGNDQVITLDVSRYDAGIYYLNILINQKEYSKAFIIMK